MRGSNRGITRNNTPLRSNKKVQDEFEDDPNTSERNSNKKSIHDDDDDDDDGNKNNDDDDDNSNVEECDYDYDYDQENIEDHQQEDIEILVQTVNNLTRMHEALAFLNDSNRNLRDKQISVRRQNRHGVTALFWAIRRGADHCLVEKMVEIGGKELVLLTNKYKENVLHNAAFCGSRYDVYKTILDAGEKDVLLQRDRLGNTPMHYSCAWGVSIRAIEYMAEIGGRDALMVKNNEGQVPHSKNTKLQEYLSEIGGLEYQIELLEQKQNAELSFFDLLMLNKTERAEIRLDDKNERKKLFDQDENGLNSLMVAIWFVGNSSPVFHSRLSSLIRKMIKKGGKELVLATNTTNSTVLHYAAFNGAPFDIIKLLVETAGQDILQKQNDWGSTPLHDSCYRHAPVEVIEYLVQQGGIGALKATNKDGITPLEILFHADIISDIHITTLQCAWYDLDPHCSRACHRKIVQKTLKWADNLDPKSLRNNNFVKALLNDRFIMNRYQMIVFADLYAQLGIVLSLSPGLITVVYGDQRSNNQSYEEIRNTFLSIMLPTLGICVSWFIGRELVQIFASPFDNYSKGYNNFIDIAQLILVCVSIHIFVEVRNGGEEELNSGATGVVICSAAVAWTQLLFAIGQLSYSVSLFTYALVQIILELAPFVLTAAIVIVAFAQMYYIGARNGTECITAHNDMEQEIPWQCDARYALFQSLAMLLTTDYEFLSMDSNDSTGGKLLTTVSIGFALIVGILLLNILIAVVNNVFTKVTEESEDAFWTTRLNFMLEVSTIRNFSYQLLQPFFRKDRDSHKTIVNQKLRKDFYLYDDNWMKSECNDDEMENFFKWWYYSWKIEKPSLRTRLKYFYGYASIEEILFPGKVFQNILFGLKYNEDIEGLWISIALVLSTTHLIVGLVITLVIFLFGLVTFGLLWPKEIKQKLFFGPIETQVKVNQQETGNPGQQRKNEHLESKIRILEQQNIEIQQQNHRILTILCEKEQRKNPFDSARSISIYRPARRDSF